MTLIKTTTRIILGILFLVPFSINVNAQDWDLNGNFVQQNQFLGSTNPQDLRFRVNNQPRMILRQNFGFLGVGNFSSFTASAHYPLGK